MAEKKYIELEAALKANCYFCSAHLEDDSPCVEKCADYMKFIEIPTADVRPVRKGRWEYNPGDNIPYCSECMMPQDTECNFCPSCGADMR